MPRASRRHGEDHNSFQSSDTPRDRANITRRPTPYDRPARSVSSFKDAQISGNMSNNRVYTAGGNLFVNDNDLVSTTLLHHVASGAMFDSGERQSAGRCHPGTRQRMIARAMYWIMETDPARTILWMCGSAGAGKSSLMQSICELLRDSDPEKNGASFFFSRGDPDRGNSTKLFVTLAYQLAVKFPSLRAEINDALHRDPTLPTKSMEIQLRSLIIDPLLSCKNLPSLTPILFIDGLDECDADDNQRVDTQCEIITLISQSLSENNIPIRFMVASRPEYWISDLFEASPLSDITLRLSLRDDCDADRDIRSLLIKRFEQIRSKKIRVMESVALPWPPEHIVERFVHDASGQYIYASTILKFVGDHPFKSPEEQLRILTTPGPHRAAAYSDLDRLYATIVSVYPEWETMKRVLGGLLLDIKLATIQVLLEVPRTEITLVLYALRSLIDVFPPAILSSIPKDDPLLQLLTQIFGQFEDETISFCHLSFREFLLDEGRSGIFHIDVEAVRRQVIGAFFGVLQRNLDENYKSEPHKSCDVGLLEYRRMMDTIIEIVPSELDDFHLRNLLPVFAGMMESFRRFDPGRRMNHPACFMRDMDLLSAFLKKLGPGFNKKFLHSKSAMDPEYNLYEAVKDDPVSKFIVIFSQLQTLAPMARRIGIHLLSLCKGFSITPTLFLLQGLKPLNPPLVVDIRNLSKILDSNDTDILSTIWQHRHIIDVKYELKMCLVNLRKTSVLVETHKGWLDQPSWTSYGAVVDLEQELGEGWLSHTEWTNQHVSLVCKCLKSIMNNFCDDGERLCVRRHCDDDKHGISYMKETFLGDFFKDGRISDIHNKEYFSNEYRLCFLEVMIDINGWSALLSSRAHLNLGLFFIDQVLRWFNRQLTNPKTTELIEDHDASLLSKMTMAMRTIFQKGVLPLFTTPYFRRLVLTSDNKTIEIKVSSSSYSEQTIDPVPREHDNFLTASDLHDEIFVKERHAGGDQSVIPRSEWYPHLAAYLLNLCVKQLYLTTKSDFKGGDYEFEFRQISPCIVQCLPYAQTTPQNLDALRAIKHLSKKNFIWPRSPSFEVGFYPPPGFCSCTRKFLTRYETSALTSEELSDFELWLQNITEAQTFLEWFNFDIGWEEYEKMTSDDI